MKIKIHTLAACLALNIATTQANEAPIQPIITDDHHSVSFSREEVKQALTHLAADTKQQTLVDDAVLIGVIGQLVENKNLSQAFDKMMSEANPETFWKNQFALRGLKNRLYIDFYQKSLVTPDMSTLALENYTANGEEIAATPEFRQSSHILILCKKNQCDDRAKKKDAAKEVLTKLHNGESFESLVKQYSEDSGSKPNKGQLTDWYQVGQSDVDAHYTQSLFTLKAVGDVSDIVKSDFGYHIIRLDGIRQKEIRPFEAVKAGMIAHLEKKYIELSLYNRLTELQMSQEIEFSIKDIRDIIKENDKAASSESK